MYVDNEKELEALIATKEKELEQLREREAELLRNIPERGFKAAKEGQRLRSAMEVISDDLRKHRKRLADSRSQASH
jgi:hypothetical protein